MLDICFLCALVSGEIEIYPQCSAGVLTGGACGIVCRVYNFDEENQYVAFQKGLLYYHYDTNFKQ